MELNVVLNNNKMKRRRKNEALFHIVSVGKRKVNPFYDVVGFKSERL